MSQVYSEEACRRKSIIEFRKITCENDDAGGHEMRLGYAAIRCLEFALGTNLCCLAGGA